MLCLLLVVCSILTSIGFNRVEARAKVDEKKLYMNYMAKVDKKWRKKIKQLNSKEEYNVWEPGVAYKILDLDGDGQKELVYMLERSCGYTCQKWRICTVKKGKVHRVWKSSLGAYVMLAKVKGEKGRLQIDYYFPGSCTHDYQRFTFSSGKIKDVSKRYLYALDRDSNTASYCFYDGNRKVEDPFDIENVKYIDTKEYK